jgi:hypothetical protein
MLRFESEDFEQVYTKAIDKGYSRDDAIRRACREGIVFLYKKFDLQPEIKTHDRLVTEALENYKTKLEIWKSHEVTVRVVVFDIRYTVSRLYRLKQVQEQEAQPSNWRYEAYSRPEVPRNNHPGAPPRPTGTGRYAFPESEYTSTSRGQPGPAGMGRYTFPKPKYQGQSRRSSTNAREYTTKEFRPSGERFTPQTPFFTWDSCKAPPPRSTYTARPKEHFTGSYGKSSYSSSYSTSDSRSYSSSDRDSRPPPRASKHSSDHDNTRRGHAGASNHSARPDPPRPSRPSHTNDYTRRNTHSYSHSQRPKTPPPPPPQPSSAPVDFYKVLGISRTATAAEIKSAYRKLSLKHHPDRVAEADKVSATEKMAEINQAHDILGDEDARREYDRWGV